ncbi:PHP domain-containing protein [bacterium]|nr:PHP domain-containing protein [bacterium]
MQSEPTPAQFVNIIDWLAEPIWLNADLHTHTRFSDGGSDVAELADAAASQGCDALAITDHIEKGSAAGTPEYLEAIKTQRLRSRSPLILAGIEWNIPPYGGREHVNILVDPTLEPQLLAFTELFKKHDSASQGLNWLAERRSERAEILAFYDHPSRRDKTVEENRKDYLNWTPDNNVLKGFEGGPGHQKANPRGAYKELFQTDQGWDPVIAKIGGVLDDFLDEGRNPWAALANSDFHNRGGDYLPCEFSRTHIAVPDVSPNGVLQGLAAGTFWGETGAFLRRLEVKVRSPDLIFDASPGESFLLGDQRSIRVAVNVVREAKVGGQPLLIEVIGNLTTGKPVLIAKELLDGDRSNLKLDLDNLESGSDGKSGYIRVRVSSISEGDRRFVAYTNHVRIFL